MSLCTGSPTVLRGFEFKRNVRAFFAQGQNKLLEIMRCLYYAGFRKASFDCSMVLCQPRKFFMIICHDKFMDNTGTIKTS